MSDQTTWPPAEGVTTPNVPSKNAVFSVTASTKINAPASFIFDILLNTSTYPEWSTFIPKATIGSHLVSTNAQTSETTSPDSVLKLGSKFTFYANMSTDPPSKAKLHPTNLIVTDISTPTNPSNYIPAATLTLEPTYTKDLGSVYRVAWMSHKSGALDVGPTAERFNEVIVLGEELCEIRTWECMGGVISHVVKWMYRATLDGKLQDWCDELKVYGELEWKKEWARSGTK
jgi:hypothetical protein